MAGLIFLAIVGCFAFNSSDYTGGSMNGFYTYDELSAWVSKMGSNSTYISTGSLGKSSQGREIPYVKLASSSTLAKSDVLVTAETSTIPVHVNSVMYQLYSKLDSADLAYDLATRNY
jgi:hypothetical protein